MLLRALLGDSLFWCEIAAISLIPISLCARFGCCWLRFLCACLFPLIYLLLFARTCLSYTLNPFTAPLFAFQFTYFVYCWCGCSDMHTIIRLQFNLTDSKDIILLNLWLLSHYLCVSLCFEYPSGNLLGKPHTHTYTPKPQAPNV